MKELSIEQKAKAYDEALERAKGVIEQNPLMEYLKKGIEYILPELKESEDERLRNAIYNCVKWFGFDSCYFKDVSQEECLAWLEKQGEKKPTGRVEPKFKVGDWVVYECWEETATLQIIRIVGETYVFSDDSTLGVVDEDTLRLWSIADAKAGDVLEFKDHERLVVGIVSYINKSTGKVDVYCLLEDNNFKVGVYYALDTINPYPATKEQRDTLMKAMADAGYTFDFESKELKKIAVPIFNIGDSIIKKHNSDINDFGAFTITDITGGKYWYNDRIICDITKQDEWELYEPVRQNPAELSEEDEANLDYLIDFCNGYYNGNKPVLTESTARFLSNWLYRLESCEISSYIRNKADWEISQDMASDLYKLSEQLKELKG